MRALSTSVVLSTMVLGGWLTGAKAQNLDLDNPPPLASAPGGPSADSENPPPGTIAQPNVESPGMVLGITLGELYTDNVGLAADGEPKRSSWITEIQPFLKAARSSPRFSGVFDAKLTGYLYAGQSSHNQLAQDLDARGTLTLVPQHLFLDGVASYGRQIIDNRRASGSGSFFLDNNHANVATAMLSPHWLQDLGNAGTMTVRLSRGRVVYNDRGIPDEGSGLLDGIPNVTMNAAQFSLVSPKYQTWGWNLGYSEVRVDPDFGRSFDFAVARAGGSFEASPNLRLLVDGGKENKYLPDGTVDKLGASFWDAGFEWSNGRDYFKLLAGHRFFGRSYQLSWTHQAERLTTNVRYVEQPTSYNQQLLGINAGAEGLPPINTRPNIPSLTERQPFLSKRWSASAAYTMSRSTFSVRAYDESRTFFSEAEQQQRVLDADVSWLFDLGPSTTLTPSFSWQRYRFRDGQTNNSRYAQLALVHQINARNFGSLRLRHGDRDVTSEVPGPHGHTVNVIFAQWTHLF